MTFIDVLLGNTPLVEIHHFECKMIIVFALFSLDILHPVGGDQEIQTRLKFAMDTLHLS
jgi:hypothetical protein